MWERGGRWGRGNDCVGRVRRHGRKPQAVKHPALPCGVCTREELQDHSGRFIQEVNYRVFPLSRFLSLYMHLCHSWWHVLVYGG